MPEKVVDFSAVGRISQRVELKTVRLMEIVAKCPSPVAGPLEATLESECSVLSNQKQTLDILCNYTFSAHASQTEVASALIKYVVSYDLRGDEPIKEEDLSQFALANGTAHSWPFVRECIYSLTSRMGYPPYTLPVVHFRPKPPAAKPVQKKKEPPSTT